HNCRFDRHDIAKHRRNDETRADIDHRNADKVVFLQHLIFVEPQSAQEKGVGSRIEVAEIVWEIHDPGGGAVAPFNGYLMAVHKHAVSNPFRTLRTITATISGNFLA